MGMVFSGRKWNVDQKTKGQCRDRTTFSNAQPDPDSNIVPKIFLHVFKIVNTVLIILNYVYSFYVKLHGHSKNCTFVTITGRITLKARPPLSSRVPSASSAKLVFWAASVWLWVPWLDREYLSRREGSYKGRDRLGPQLSCGQSVESWPRLVSWFITFRGMVANLG
jgi:hypothetical protein